jgi:hypothetical protein
MEEVKIFTVFGDVQELFNVKVLLFCKPIILFQKDGVLHYELPITNHLNGTSPPETDQSKLRNIMANVIVIRIFLTFTEWDASALVNVLEKLGAIVVVSHGCVLNKSGKTLLTILVCGQLHRVIRVVVVHTCFLLKFAANKLL